MVLKPMAHSPTGILRKPAHAFQPPLTTRLASYARRNAHAQAPTRSTGQCVIWVILCRPKRHTIGRVLSARAVWRLGNCYRTNKLTRCADTNHQTQMHCKQPAHDQTRKRGAMQRGEDTSGVESAASERRRGDCIEVGVGRKEGGGKRGVLLEADDF